MLRNAKSKARSCGQNAFLRPWLTSIARTRAYNLRPNAFTQPRPIKSCAPSRKYSSGVPVSQGIELVDDTIYALSTATGRAGIAIIRISGVSCLDIYRNLCPNKIIPKPRHASLRTLYNPSPVGAQDILDSDALVLYFPTPNTVTGEDVLELHIHGGPATVKAVLSAIPNCPSQFPIRYAEPGEFTRRAFQNDRLDLAQVEALSDTLSAETEQQRRAAVRGNSGRLGRTYESWREQLLYARGELEALIDFSEDQHFDESPAELMSSVASQVKAMLRSIETHELASHRGELLKKGIRISLLGPPNAGKSSLLNRIVGREASIVSHEAGTTRDIVEVSLDIRGYLCSFADTAGLRTHGDGHPDPHTTIGLVEQEGIRRAKAKAGESDVVVALASVEPSSGSDGWSIQYDLETLSIAANATESIIVVNKTDHVSVESLDHLIKDFRALISDISGNRNIPVIPISCMRAQLPTTSTLNKSGNIAYFLDTLVAAFKNMTSLPPDLEDLLGVTQRQRELLEACSQYLLDFVAEAEVSSDDGSECDIVVAAEHLRAAANCLSKITGRGEASDVEEVLGVVFEK
ncbi:tRNA modification GTPase-like protein mss1 [Xylogone sp. PMI_703]|nr:tRNA modification GTPase-like protein mss1 [Xylogone sp. PMI_703]